MDSIIGILLLVTADIISKRSHATAWFLVLVVVYMEKKTLKMMLRQILNPNVDRHRWSPEKANAWNEKQRWALGPNFVPSTASNPLEMWQDATWDPITIKRELGWMPKWGVNTVRVFLHYLPFQEDPKSFMAKVDTFLGIADYYNVKTILVFFDDVWNANPEPGPQPDPIPHRHNSRWVQCPGSKGLKDLKLQDTVLKAYVQTIIQKFAYDDRILFWDLYNEPGNLGFPEHCYGHILNNKQNKSLVLLKKSYKWAWEIPTIHPLTSAIWGALDITNLTDIEWVQVEWSDILSFHNYEDIISYSRIHKFLQTFNRPLMCTEFLARTDDENTFQNILPYAAKHKVGSIFWGWVSGRTQTQYPWHTWWDNVTEEPKIWHHDVLQSDGTPFDEQETQLMLNLTSKQNQTTQKKALRRFDRSEKYLLALFYGVNYALGIAK